MKWESEGVLIANKLFSEDKLITTVFTKDFGIKKGLTKASKKSYLVEPGNIVKCCWSARLENHLGYLKIETINPITTFCLLEPEKLTILNSILSVIIKVLPENQEKSLIYKELILLLKMLKAEENNNNKDNKKDLENSLEYRKYYNQYIKFDLLLLKDLGFALELNKCTATGSIEELIYISPRTGKAVSRDAGEKYKDKLLTLPSLLLKLSRLKASEGRRNALIDHRDQGRKVESEKSNSYELKAALISEDLIIPQDLKAPDATIPLLINKSEFIECMKITNYFIKKFLFDNFKFEFPYYRKLLTML